MPISSDLLTPEELEKLNQDVAAHRVSPIEALQLLLRLLTRTTGYTPGLKQKESLLASRDKALTWQEFVRLLEFIDGRHGFHDMPHDNPEFAPIWKGIKYIDPTIDLRDNRIYRIEFRGLFGKGGEPVVFDERQSGERMCERISRWLEEEE